MKCPYKKKITTSYITHVDRTDTKVITTEFTDCDESDCPFYFKGNYLKKVCNRALKELEK